MGKYMWRKYIRVVAGLIPLAQRARGYFWILVLPGHRWHNWAWRPAGIRAQLFPTGAFQPVSVDARLRLA